MEKLHSHDISLAEATIADFNFFYKLKCEKKQIYWGGFSGKPDYKKLQQWFQNILLNKTKIILMIKWNGENVGYISFKIFAEKICSDHGTAVAEKMSGLGIGTLAIKKNEEYLKKHYPNCKTIIGFVRADNGTSQKMLKKCGWILTDDYLDRFIMPEKKVVRMQKWVKELSILR